MPRRVKFLIFSQILNNFGFGYFIIYITVYLPEININAGVVGILLGVQGVVLVLAGIPLGLLSDLRGRKWFLIFGNLLVAPTILIFAFTNDFTFFLFAAALGGLAEAAALSSWNAIIADQTDLTNRDAAFSLSFIVSNIFLSLGMALPFFFPGLQSIVGLSSQEIHRLFLLLFGLANFIAPLLIFALLRGYKETVIHREEASRRGSIRILLKFSGINSLIGLGAGLIIPLVGTWLYYKFGVPDTYNGPFLAISGMTIAFSAVGSSRLSARFGLFKSILMTSGSSTLFMFSLAFIPNVFLAGGVYIVRTALMNMSAPLMDSFLMGIITPDRRGLASALSAIIWRIPNSLSSILGGFLIYTGHYDLPWLGASLLYVVAIALLYANFKDVKPKG
ncbi:MAG: MFS transporter [Thaumarchaeota archaeon]|nr:MFS transporter [Nitrososphaerota archaeon]